MKIYIACALTHVPRDKFVEYTGFIHGLAAALRSDGPQTEVRYALVNSDPQLATRPVTERARLCYLWDRDMVEAADIVIAEASFPSIGLGIEMQIAEAKDKPIVLCFRDYSDNKAEAVSYENPDRSRHDLQIGEGYVTLIALGVPSIYRIVKYEGAKDGITQVLRAVRLLNRAQ
jgi:hypothetical protein